MDLSDLKNLQYSLANRPDAVVINASDQHSIKLQKIIFTTESQKNHQVALRNERDVCFKNQTQPSAMKSLNKD